jgi:hypothetical protein
MSAGPGDVDDLELNDWLAVKHLKYLRNRSMANSRWRDPDYVLLYVTPGSLAWEPEGPLADYRVGVERALKTYKAAKRKGRRADLDELWSAVLGAVDELIAEAERIVGHRIKPSA